jgi:excisionase family DNA binding protein
VTDENLTTKLLYTPVEAAKTLGISRSTLYLLLASGKLDSVKVGTLRRITQSALQEFVVRLATETVTLGPKRSGDTAWGLPSWSPPSGKLESTSPTARFDGSKAPVSAGPPPNVVQHNGTEE